MSIAKFLTIYFINNKYKNKDIMYITCRLIQQEINGETKLGKYASGFVIILVVLPVRFTKKVANG